MAKKAAKKSQVEEIIEQLLEKGRKEGSLTQKEIADALSDQEEITVERLDDIYETVCILRKLVAFHSCPVKKKSS